MKQTPPGDNYNAEIFGLIPGDTRRIVEAGCSNGNLARASKAARPACEYIGIEIEPEYAELARSVCDRVVVGDVEHLDDATFASLFPSDCWIFSDVLEHLYDPWTMLKRLRSHIAPDGTVLACIPNAQHWSVQWRINSGEFRYEDSGLLDRTHIRWFTKTTIVELFRTAGFTIVEGMARVLTPADPQWRDRALVGVRAMAEATRTDADVAMENANAFQWIVRAMPTP